MKRWSEVELGSRCEVFSGYPFKSAKFTQDPDDVALVKGENVGQGEILWEISKRWPREDAEDLARYRLKPDDVVLAMDRPWVPAGLKFARISPLDPEALLVQRVARLRAIDGLDQRYLYYVIASANFVAYVKNVGRGVGVPHISGKQIGEYRLRLPPREVQGAIVDILSAYDDLIENNRRRMALLEEAARQLYREWFVCLRFPGREHTRTTNGVPDAWERRPLESCAIFRSGGTPSKARSEYWEGDIPWASSGEISETRIYDTPLHVSPEGAEAGSRLVSPNTILIVVRGMSLAKEFRMATVAREMAFNQDLKALEAKESVDSLFLFHSLLEQRDRIRDLATEASHGTKKLDTAVLERLPILVAESRLQRLFRDIVAPSLAQRDNLFHQNTRLRAARDLLLPRLMSGEITV